MTAPLDPADAGQESPGRRSPRSGPGARRRRIRIVVAVVAVLVVLLGADAAVIGSRIDRFEVDLSEGLGTTWVLVGLDSRAALPEGSTPEDFGTPEEVPGSRADVVVVLQETADGLQPLSIPRDVLVRWGTGGGRLALSWLDGPQATVDALCSLGISADHVVTIDLAGFAAVVDALGGLDVKVPAAVRDAHSGLLFERAGSHHVDGATALAMVRSRHPQHLVDGRWVTAEVDPDGRTATAGVVLSALAAAGHREALRPWRLQRLAWTGSDAIAVDEATSLPELAALAARDIRPVEVLPVSPPRGETIPRAATDETAQALSDAGLSCAG
jgi:LCP family protein required for cell wall assembly